MSQKGLAQTWSPFSVSNISVVAPKPVKPSNSPSKGRQSQQQPVLQEASEELQSILLQPYDLGWGGEESSQRQRQAALLPRSHSVNTSYKPSSFSQSQPVYIQNNTPSTPTSKAGGCSFTPSSPFPMPTPPARNHNPMVMNSPFIRDEITMPDLPSLTLNESPKHTTNHSLLHAGSSPQRREEPIGRHRKSRSLSVGDAPSLTSLICGAA